MQPSKNTLPRPRATDTGALLRNTLRVDAVFCAIGGVDLLAFSGIAGELLGLHRTGFLAVVGAGLLAYAALLTVASRREPLSMTTAWAFALADLAWVAASGALIAFGPPSTSGNWIVGAVAVVTLAMAELKMLGIRRIRRAAPPRLGEDFAGTTPLACERPSALRHEAA
jgi:hypothetical protein